MNSELEKFNRKRLNYQVAEDFYLTSLVALIVLAELKTSSIKPFVDFTKIGFLSEFVLDSSLVRILQKTESLSTEEKDSLIRAFSRGELRLSYLSKVGLALEKKGIVGMSLNQAKETVDWYLQKNSMPAAFYDKELFSIEIQNIHALNKLFHSLRTVSANKVKETLFKRYGIMKWQD